MIHWHEREVYCCSVTVQSGMFLKDNDVREIVQVGGTSSILLGCNNSSPEGWLYINS